MWEQIELSRQVKVARTPPGRNELEALHREGVRSIIDLRTDAEPPGERLSPLAEAADARAQGIEHIRVPVSASRVGTAELDRVGEALRDAPKPVLIHCASGRRAGMIALIHTAIETGTPGAEMLEMGRHLDLVFGDHDQQQVFANYVDRREIPPDALHRREEALRVDGRPIPLLPAATREEMQEEKHRRSAPDGGTPARRSQAPSRRIGARVRTLPLRAAPVPSASHRVSMTLAAAAGIAILLLDKRVRVPLLIAAGLMAGRAVVLLRAQSPAPSPPPIDPALDRDIAELERRVRRLSKTT